MTTPPAPPPLRTACGGLITDDPAHYPSALYQGHTVYFCLRACLSAFVQAPDRFMAGEVPHPAEETDEAAEHNGQAQSAPAADLTQAGDRGQFLNGLQA